MQVVDTSGGAVGTVVRVDGANIVIKTNEDALPKTSFTAHEGKLLFGMTQAQLNAEVEKSKAEAAKAITPGATVKARLVRLSAPSTPSIARRSPSSSHRARSSEFRDPEWRRAMARS